MKIKDVSFINFRSYEKGKLELSDNMNVIYGANGAGKTNILEAIYLFCSGRSHRGARELDLIKKECEFSRIDMNFSDENRDYSGVLKLSHSKKKQIFINGVLIRKISKIADYINAVMFSPEDMGIIKETPAERRRFLDSSICSLRPVYLSLLVDYLHILQQKNSLLKDISKTGINMDEMLDIWDEKAAKTAASIYLMRKKFISELNEVAKKIHFELCGENLEIIYRVNGISGKNVDFSDVEDAAEFYLKIFKESRKSDILQKFSSVGIHRDDLIFHIDGKDSKRFASQGQQRSIVLTLKLALAEIIYLKKGSYPVILLDDILSELDIDRRNYFLNKIKGKQVIITCTEKENACVLGDVKYFKVENGEVKEG